MNTLLIGAGNSRVRALDPTGAGHEFVGDVITLDIEADCNPDIVHDLNVLPLPFDTNEFDEVHGYEVLEHVGVQGDYRSFFDLFTELWRITKPGGFLCATVPMWSNLWAWGDPGHTRVINAGTIAFLSQDAYAREVGNTPMTDYREVYSADWECIHSLETEATYYFALRAVK